MWNPGGPKAAGVSVVCGQLPPPLLPRPLQANAALGQIGLNRSWPFWATTPRTPLPSAGPPSPRLWGRRGFTRQPENSKRAHFRAPALHTPPKFHEKTLPREGRKNEKCGGRGEKARKFWASTLSGPHPSGPHPPGASPFNLNTQTRRHLNTQTPQTPKQLNP